MVKACKRGQDSIIASRSRGPQDRVKITSFAFHQQKTWMFKNVLQKACFIRFCTSGRLKWAGSASLAGLNRLNWAGLDQSSCCGWPKKTGVAQVSWSDRLKWIQINSYQLPCLTWKGRISQCGCPKEFKSAGLTQISCSGWPKRSQINWSGSNELACMA